MKMFDSVSKKDRIRQAILAIQDNIRISWDSCVFHRLLLMFLPEVATIQQ